MIRTLTNILRKRIKLGGVSLWDLTASYPITSHLSIRGRIANLF